MKLENYKCKVPTRPYFWMTLATVVILWIRFLSEEKQDQSAIIKYKTFAALLGSSLVGYDDKTNRAVNIDRNELAAAKQ